MSAPRHTTAHATAPANGKSTLPFDYARAAQVLTDAAARAGARIMAHFHGTTHVTLKPDHSPVTEADRDSEAIILEALKELTPDIPSVSEEGGGGSATGELGDRFFLVDPLDGTKEFIGKRSDFTVNIGLIDDGRPCFGLVYAPARGLLALTIAEDEAVEAELAPSASGADFGSLALRPLHTRKPDLAALTAVVSHSHLDPSTEAFLGKLNIAERWSAGSSVKLIEIARGDADVYPRFGTTMEWDTAAGHAILNAAGGSIVTPDGRTLGYGKSQAGLRNPGFIAWGAERPPV